RGMMVDLVILNAHPYTYPQELNDRIVEAMFTASDSDVIDRPGGVFVRRRDLLAAEDLLMLRATARVHIPCDGRSLGRIVAAAHSDEERDAEADEPYALPFRASPLSTPPSSPVMRQFRALASALVTDRPQRGVPAQPPNAQAPP